MDKAVQGLEDYSYDEIIDLINDFIIDKIWDSGHSADDIKLNDIRLHGSRLRNQAKLTSDLDAVVEYELVPLVVGQFPVFVDFTEHSGLTIDQFGLRMFLKIFNCEPGIFRQDNIIGIQRKNVLSGRCFDACITRCANPSVLSLDQFYSGIKPDILLDYFRGVVR
jgi:predicted nucleotidyltransferase